ncbi:MAG: thioredoxin domain-containing protein, partial [Bdellovibrionales bacterium]|nr:thioredoxin domain-containing protein [Bdellovibrionales bacterium]
EGEAAGQGTLEDYAFLAESFIALHEATLDPVWMERARELHAQTVARFWDEEHAGYYLSEAGRTDLIARMKDVDDNALPSSMAVAVLNGLKLSEVFAVEEWKKQSERTLEVYAGYLEKHPVAVTQLLIALDWLKNPVKEVVLAPAADARGGGPLKQFIDSRYLPHALVVSTALQGSPLTEHRSPRQGKETAYVCEGQTCQAPVTEVEALRKLLE